MDFLPGYRFGPYEVTGELGTGGMGVVLRAIDTRLHREVAVKVLHVEKQTPGLRERFLREARASSALNHPNICMVFDIGEDDGIPYMVMELLRGESLRDVIRRSSIPVERIIKIGTEVAEALMAAHAKGIIHRDIKPANILLLPKPNAEQQVKVLDFGLAKYESRRGSDHLTEGLTTTGVTVGTVAYMSPEQARGETLDARSDLFSLGIVLYEMATGTVPFHGATSALVFVELLSKDPTPVREWNRSIPPLLEKVILRLLAKKPEDRYQNAGELYAALKALDSASLPSLGHIQGRSEELSSRSSKASRQIYDPPKIVDPSPRSENRRLRSDTSVPLRRTSTRAAVQIAQESQEPERGPKSQMLVYVVLGCVLLVGCAGFLIYRSKHTAAVKSDALAIAGQIRSIQMGIIENKTGNASLYGVAPAALEILLNESPYIHVRSDIDMFSHAGSSSIHDGESVRTFAHQRGATHYLMGVMDQPSPNRYTIEIDVFRTADKQKIGDEEEEISNQQELPEALQRIAQRLRTDLQEADSSIVNNSVPLDREASDIFPVITSLPQVRRLWAAGDDLSAARQMRGALDRSPHCVACRLMLAWMQLDADATSEATSSLAQVEADLPRSSQRCRLWYSFLLQMVRGNPAESASVARKWINERPADLDAYVAMAFALRADERYAEAGEQSQNAIKLDPDDPHAILEKTKNLLALNRFQAILDLSMVGNTSTYRQLFVPLMAAYGLGQESTVEDIAHSILRRNYLQDQIVYASYLDDVGQMKSSGEIWSAAAGEVAIEPALASTASSIRARAAMNRALLGDCTGAMSWTRDIPFEKEVSAHAVFLAGMSSALCNRVENAERSVSQLEVQYQTEPTTQNSYLPILRAAIDLHAGHAIEAEKHLANVRGAQKNTFALYLHVKSCLLQMKMDTAAAEQQSILSDRGASLLGGDALYPATLRQRNGDEGLPPPW